MKIEASNKNIISLALPILFALLIPQVSYVANSVFLGRFGELELRVVGVAGVFYLLLSMVGYGLSNGLQIQMARRAGEQDHEGLARTFVNGAFLSLLLSLGMMVLSLWLAPLIFGLSLHNSENIFESIRFLYIRVWGLPFLMLAQLANAFFISIHRSRFLIYSSLAGTLTNIVLDYLLIFGYGGFPAMGLAGAAIASIAGEVVSCITIWSAFYFNRFYKQFPIHQYLFFDYKLSQNSLKIASPLIVQYLFSIGGWQIFFIFIEHLGNTSLAASQILRSVFGVAWVGIWAFSATANTMVSNIIGQGKNNQVMQLINKIARLSFLYALSICIILFLFANQFIAFYRNDPQIIQLAIPALHLLLFSTLLMSVSTVMFNGVVGTGNTLINLSMEVTSVSAYVVYCYVVIERLQLSLTWAWGSEFVYWVCLLGISLLYLRSGRWRGKNI